MTPSEQPRDARELPTRPLWAALVGAILLSALAFGLVLSLLSVALESQNVPLPSSGSAELPTSASPASGSPTQSSSRATGATPTTTSGLRLEVIRTALTVVAGAGGIVALVVTYRRQRLAEYEQKRQERVDRRDEHDATERRITELYSKAVEQLGSGQPAVRLGALYALERLAQGNASHRQTVVDVLCAYLRMPYGPTEDTVVALADPGWAPIERHRMDAGPVPTDAAERNDQISEAHVHVAAQKILIRHCTSSIEGDGGGTASADFVWPGVVLDLSDTCLLHLQASNRRFNAVSFERAVLLGRSNFWDALFEKFTSFDGAHFDDAQFMRTRFSRGGRFFHARFREWAWFEQAEFRGSVDFQGAEFGGVVGMDNTRFLSEEGVPLEDAQGHLLRGASHSDLNAHVTRRWPSGWQVVPVGKKPSHGWLQHTSERRPAQ